MILTNINIEQKQSKNGKTYWMITSNEGKYSIWDQEMAFEIMQKGYTSLDVVTESKNGFNNIKVLMGGNFDAPKNAPIKVCNPTVGNSIEERSAKWLEMEARARALELAVKAAEAAGDQSFQFQIDLATKYLGFILNTPDQNKTVFPSVRI